MANNLSMTDSIFTATFRTSDDVLAPPPPKPKPGDMLQDSLPDERSSDGGAGETTDPALARA